MVKPRLSLVFGAFVLGGCSQSNALSHFADLVPDVAGPSPDNVGDSLAIAPDIAQTAAVSSPEVAQAPPEPNWTPGAVWQLYQEDWQFSLPTEYASKEAGKDYGFAAKDKPLRHSDFLIDGLADGKRDGWTSMADRIALMSTKDFGLIEHPDPALHYAQPWKISGERTAQFLNHGAARGVVLSNGKILRQAKGEIEPRRAELLKLFAEGACLDWTGTLFEPDGSRVEFEKDGEIQFAVLDSACYPVMP